MIKKKHVRIEQLTGLRYFAALLVFVSHLQWIHSYSAIKYVAKSGFVGVSFFFILSGFVLSHSYQTRIVCGQINFGRYLLLRLARLSPLHFAASIPFIIDAVQRGVLKYGVLFLNLSFLQSWVPNAQTYFSINPPSWSLSNEMFFYVVFFFLVSFPFQKLCKISLSMFMVVFISALCASIYLGQTVFFGNLPFVHWLFYIFPGFRLLEFLTGMVLYELWKKGYRFKGYLLPVSYGMLFLIMYYATYIPQPFRMSLYFLPVMSFFFYAHLTEETIACRLYASRLLVLLGNASFAFYLLHFRLIHVFRAYFAQFELSDSVFFLIALVLISLISVATYLLYEKWTERVLKNCVLRMSLQRVKLPWRRNKFLEV